MSTLIDIIKTGKCTPQIVQVLLAVEGINVNAVDSQQNTALIWAACQGQTEIVQALLAVEGINVNAVDDGQKTALIWAVYKGQTEIVQALLAVEGINVNAVDDGQKTALDHAKNQQQLEIVRLLEDYHSPTTQPPQVMNCKMTKSNKLQLTINIGGKTHMVELPIEINVKLVQ